MKKPPKNHEVPEEYKLSALVSLHFRAFLDQNVFIKSHLTSVKA